MPLITIGINHQTAPLAIRERMAFNAEQTPAALARLLAVPGVEEAVLLSTCNRTEIYCAAAEPGRVADWLVAERTPEDPGIAERLYRHRDGAAVRHLLRVAAGLDSMVLGEPQILGQLKQAYQMAGEQGATGSLMHRLFQHAFAVAKQVRTRTSIGASPVSVAFAAVSLARQIFGDFGNCTALLIGAGETVELAARHLHDKGLERMIVANRTLARAHAVAEPFAGYAIPLSELAAHLGEADIVIASTASPEPVLTETMARTAFGKRRARPVFMVDLAVPRDIESAVGELEDVYLYTIDDLQSVIRDSLRSRQAAARQAEEIIDAEAELFTRRLRALDAVPVIRALRTEAEARKQATLDRARHMLAAGKPPEEALEYLANTLTNRLLHRPTTGLRDAAHDEDLELLLAARRLFGVDDTDS